MADQWSGGQSGPGERWNVNLPAVIGVVFVFLVGVIVWVVVASASDDDGALPGESVPSVPTSTIAAIPTVPTTTPLPMPSTTVVPPTASADRGADAAADRPADDRSSRPRPRRHRLRSPPRRSRRRPTTPLPLRRRPRAPTTTVSPGGVDLGVPGPPDHAAAVRRRVHHGPGLGDRDQATADSMEEVLDQYSGSHYLRTDVTCSSLTPSSNGQPIYVVYLGPYATDREACAARSQGPDDAYVRRLSNDVPPSHSVDCD